MVATLEKMRIVPTVSVAPEAVPEPEKLRECEVVPTASLEKLRADYSQLSGKLHEVTKAGMNVWSGVLAEAASGSPVVPDSAKEGLKALYRTAYGLPADHPIELTVRFDGDRAVFGPTDLKHGRMLAAYELNESSVQKVSNTVTVRSLGIDSCVDDLKR